jgi:phenylalanyl-tRNA synthetase beta subunit
MERTLEDADIEKVMSKVMSALKTQCNAELR